MRLAHDGRAGRRMTAPQSGCRYDGSLRSPPPRDAGRAPPTRRSMPVIRSEARAARRTVRALDLEEPAARRCALRLRPQRHRDRWRGSTCRSELRNAIARLDDRRRTSSAGAVHLLDDRWRTPPRRARLRRHRRCRRSRSCRRSTTSRARSQPFAEIRNGRGAVRRCRQPAASTSRSRSSCMADIGAPRPRDHEAGHRTSCEQGGTLLALRRPAPRHRHRRAHARCGLRRRRPQARRQPLLGHPEALRAVHPREPVFRRRGAGRDRASAARSWPSPTATWPQSTWAALADGTPIVTADQRGDGMIVLFHVTADTTWSNLPLSGLFVDMLRRIVALAGAPSDAECRGRAMRENETVAPRLTLDGYGLLRPPPATARAGPAQPARSVPTASIRRASTAPSDSSLAVNALLPPTGSHRSSFAPLNARIAPLDRARRPSTCACRCSCSRCLLLIVHARRPSGSAAVCSTRGRPGAAPRRPSRGRSPLRPSRSLNLPRPRREPRGPPIAHATESAPRAVTRPRLCGHRRQRSVDETSRGRPFRPHRRCWPSAPRSTPGDPIGIDPVARRARLLSAPLLARSSPARPHSVAGARSARLDAFMKGGGTVIFDTRDATTTARPTARRHRRAATALRGCCRASTFPPLEPVPADHVLTKTFYILDDFPGRYATRPTLGRGHAARRRRRGDRPARAGDGVSSILDHRERSRRRPGPWTQNGERLLPDGAGAIRASAKWRSRAGVNIVMYTLTGNYKADQVHVPALLEAAAAQMTWSPSPSSRFAAVMAAHARSGAGAVAALLVAAGALISRGRGARPARRSRSVVLFARPRQPGRSCVEDREPRQGRRGGGHRPLGRARRSATATAHDRRRRARMLERGAAERRTSTWSRASSTPATAGLGRRHRVSSRPLAARPRRRPAGARSAASSCVTDGLVHDIPPCRGLGSPGTRCTSSSPAAHGEMRPPDRADRRRRASASSASAQTIRFASSTTARRAPAAPASRVAPRRRDLARPGERRPARSCSCTVDIAHGGRQRRRVRGGAARRRADRRPTTAPSSLIEGIRENLRVLLVSGEPHAGERTWRNLLKSDANRSTSSISPSCARRRSRTARRSTNCR